MAGTIGIKIANGDFYPIIEENTGLKKRLVLTTVHDNQRSVQIDLFRSLSKSMLDSQYVGSLVVDNLKPRPKGEPSVAMTISSDEDGYISAEARDLDQNADSEHYTLNVSLKNLNLDDDGFPEFDFENGEPPSGLFSSVEGEKEEEKRKFPWLIMGLATVIVVLAIGLIWFFFLGGRQSFRENERAQAERLPAIDRPIAPVAQQPVTPPPEPIQPPAPPPPAAPPVAPPATPPPPVIQAPVTPPPPRPQEVQRVRPPAPVMSHRVPAVIPRNGVVYQIQWGDTLWDISQAFYRSPWHYQRIARFNNIQNPDRILAGFNIRIPPLN